MKKTYILFIYILTFSCLLNAQGTQEDFDKAVDYCACKISYAYTSQYANGNSSTNAEKKSFAEKIKPEIINCSLSNSIDDRKLKNLLAKNNFPTFSNQISPISNNVKQLFKTTLNQQDAINVILNGFYNNEVLKKTIQAFTDINDLKGILKNDLKGALNTFTKVKNPVPSVQIKVDYALKSEISRLEKLIKDNNSSSSI